MGGRGTPFARRARRATGEGTGERGEPQTRNRDRRARIGRRKGGRRDEREVAPKGTNQKGARNAIGKTNKMAPSRRDGLDVLADAFCRNRTVEKEGGLSPIRGRRLLRSSRSKGAHARCSSPNVVQRSPM